MVKKRVVRQSDGISTLPGGSSTTASSVWRAKKKCNEKFALGTVLSVLACSFLSLALTLTSTSAQSRTLGEHFVYLPLILRGWSSSISKLLITEVMYDVGDEPEEEWVEIYNAGSVGIDLASYKLGDEENRGGSEGMLQFPPGATIAPGQVMVIANNAVSFFWVYGFDPDFEIRDSGSAVPEMVIYTDWGSSNMQLSNTGDEVLLLAGGDELVDAISWGNSTWAFDPSAKDVKDGHSLERYPVSWDTDTAVDWRDQDAPAPDQVDLSIPTLTPAPTPTPTPAPLPPLVINEILADPAGDLPGDANGDGIRDGSDDEFVEILNTADFPIDISGWTLRDSVRVRHVFLNGTVIPTGCAIVVFGGGNPTGDFGNCVVQIASTGTLGLNNSGDTVTLHDMRSRVIDSYHYGSAASHDQSLTRAPEITGEFVKHSEAPGAGGALFSPGTQVDGTPFVGCAK